MTRRKFDRFMVHVDIAWNLKRRDLTPAERCCHVEGVLALAAKSPIPGHLLVGTEPASATLVARQANTSRALAARTLTKLRALGLLFHDDQLDCDVVHDWDDWNPSPKKDPTNAERQARYREKHQAANAARNGSRNAPVTLVTNAPEGKGREVEVQPPFPPEGESSVTLIAPVKPIGNRSRDLAGWQAELDAWVGEHFPGCEPKAVEKVVDWVRSHGDDPTPDAVRAFAAAAPTFAHLLEPAA